MPKKHENPTQRANGWWYYRRRIPKHLQGVWRDDGGRQTEHILALKTKDEAEAKRRSKFEDRLFEDKLNLKEEELAASESLDETRIRNFQYFEHRLREAGLHHSQVPSIDSPPEVIRKFLRDRQAFAYGSWIQIDGEHGQFEGGLYDEVHELAMEYDHSGDPATKQKLDDAVYKLNITLGKTKDVGIQISVPTIGVAKEEYLQYIANKAKSPDAKEDESRRVERIVGHLAFVLGNGDPKAGLQRSIASIRSGDVKQFLARLAIRENGSDIPKSPSAVGRELQTMNSIWNMAYEERKEDWPTDVKTESPFAKKRSKLNKEHDDKKKAGLVPDKDRRPFSPRELEIFMFEHLPRMNEEAQLIALIGNHTGCRIGDAAGLKMNDLYLHPNNEHPIPFIFFRDNTIRQLTKDGVQRRVPLFGDVLNRLIEYHDKRISALRADDSDILNAALFPRYGRGQKGSDAVSNLINQKHIHHLRDGDLKLTFHSFRHTLQHKYLAAGQNTQFAGYISGWKLTGLVGKQSEYVKHGIPPEALIDGLKKAHAAKSWGDADMDAALQSRIDQMQGQ